jgi:serine/threonine protein kinase
VPRFQREAKLLSGLVHPNIVRALDFGLLDEAVPYVLMELVSGATLTQQLRQSGPMSELEVIERFVPILEGLHRNH